MHLCHTRTWNLFSILCSLIIIAALTGCGGGGGGGSSAAVAPDLAVRQIQLGDAITYSVTTTTTDPANRASTTTTGTMSYNVLNDTAQPQYGVRCLKLDAELKIKQTVGQLSYKYAVYIEQGEDGTQYYSGWTGTFDQVERRLVSSTDKPVYIPSPLSVGKTYTYTATYTNDGKRQINGEVVGYETVNGVKAYKLHETSPLNDINWSCDKWIAAELGYDVKMVQKRTMTDGTIVTTVYQLATKNF